MKRSSGDDQEVIDISDGESIKGQRDEKSGRMEAGSDLSLEVIALRQKVAELQMDFEGACRFSRRFEMGMEERQRRVEFLENLLENQPSVVDESDKKLAEELQRKLAETSVELEKTRRSLTQQLNEEKLKAAEKRNRDRKRMNDLICKLAEYEDGKSLQRREVLMRQFDSDRMLDRFVDINAKLEDTRRKEEDAIKKAFEKAQEVIVLQLEIVSLKRNIGSTLNDQQLQQRLDSMAQQLKLEREMSSDDRLRDRARIAELSQKLTQCAGERKLQQHNPNQKKMKKTKKPSHKSNSPSIFRLYPAGATDAISYTSAVELLNERFFNSDEEWYGRYEQAMNSERNQSSLHCAACRVTLTKFYILPHFFSPNHAAQMRKSNAAVSTVAFESWKNKLESIPKPLKKEEEVDDVPMELEPIDQSTATISNASESSDDDNEMPLLVKEESD